MRFRRFSRTGSEPGRGGGTAKGQARAEEAAEISHAYVNLVVVHIDMHERDVAAEEERSDWEHDEISQRELEVLRLLAGPLSLREAASELYISHNTIKTHCKSIYRKLGVTQREDAVRVARDMRLLP